MSKQNFERTLRRELEVLNDQIDHKIIKGLPYGKESRRHKFIVQRLSEIRKNANSRANWLGRSLGFATTFIL